MARIFLNYRRGDASGHALRLERELRRSFGAGNVFLGIAWRERDEARLRPVGDDLGATDVLLVLIGPVWFQRDASGQPLIYDPDDEVRLQIEAALSREVRVIPVLINDAELPPTDELPGPIRVLAYLPKTRIREVAWDDDASELVSRLKGRKGFFIIGSQTAGQVEVGGSFVLPPAAERLPTMFEKAAFAGIVPAWPYGAQPSRAPGDLWTYNERLEYEPDYEAIQPQPAPPPAPPPRYGRAEEPSRAGCLARLPLALVGAISLGAGLAVLAKWVLGWFVADVEPTATSGDMVECTVFAPPSAPPGDTILVQVFAHLPEQADVARAIAMELDTDAHRRTFRSLEVPVPPGARLQFELRMPGLEVDDPVASLIWQRRAEAVQFGVRLPPETPAGAVIGTVEISLDSAPIGHVKFKLTVDPLRRQRQLLGEPQGEQARRYRAAFISYASGDRAKVLARVQMLSIVGIRYLQDVLSLEPGDRWEKKLELGIEECDLFLLFWSTESKRSEWVRKEVRYALARRGRDELSPPEIRPVILEGPPIVEPWEELAHLHFNDRMLYFMRPPDDVTHAP